MSEIVDGEKDRRLDEDNPTLIEWVSAVAILTKCADLILERIEHMRKKEKGLR